MRHALRATSAIALSAAMAMFLFAPTAFADPDVGSDLGYEPSISPTDLGLDDLDLGSSGPAPVKVDKNNYAQDCPDVMIVAVTGATDSKSDRNPLDELDYPLFENWVGNITVPSGIASKQYPGRVGWMYVPYASEYGVSVLSDVPTYQQSVAEGLGKMNQMIEDNKTKCGDATKYVLLGYSVGAEVAERAAVDIGSRPDDAHVSAKDIAGIAFVGDPYRPVGTPSIDKAGPPGGGFMSSEPKDYGKLADKIVSACRPVDIACDAPQNIAILPLALGIFGQMHFTLLNPIGTVVDFANVTSALAARTIAYAMTTPGFADSDEGLLDVALRESDQTEPDPPVTAEQYVAAAQWATGRGRDVIAKKLETEGAKFDEDNKDFFDLVLQPYLLLGFVQHLYYWDNFPDNGRDWESEKLIWWITDLAKQEADNKAAAQSQPAAPPPVGYNKVDPLPVVSEPSAPIPGEPVTPPPVAPGNYAGPGSANPTTADTLHSILESFGIPEVSGK